MCPIFSLTVLLEGGYERISRSQDWKFLQLRDFGILFVLKRERRAHKMEPPVIIELMTELQGQDL